MEDETEERIIRIFQEFAELGKLSTEDLLAHESILFEIFEMARSRYYSVRYLKREKSFVDSGI